MSNTDKKITWKLLAHWASFYYMEELEGAIPEEGLSLQQLIDHEKIQAHVKIWVLLHVEIVGWQGLMELSRKWAGELEDYGPAIPAAVMRATKYAHSVVTLATEAAYAKEAHTRRFAESEAASRCEDVARDLAARNLSVDSNREEQIKDILGYVSEL